MDNNQDIANEIQEFEKNIIGSSRELKIGDDFNTDINGIINGSESIFKVEYLFKNTPKRISRLNNDLNYEQKQLFNAIDNGCLSGTYEYNYHSNMISKIEKEINSAYLGKTIIEYELIDTTFDEQISKLEEKLKIEENDIIFLKTEHTEEDSEKLKDIENDLKFINNYIKDPNKNKEAVIDVFLRNIDLLEEPNLRCNGIDYYRIDNPDKPLYRETFEYNEDITKCFISELKKADNEHIGSRFYSDDYSNKSINHLYNFTILNFYSNEDPHYKLLEIGQEETDILEQIQKSEEIIYNIHKEKFKNQLGYEINGNNDLNEGYLKVLEKKLLYFKEYQETLIIESFLNLDKTKADNQNNLNETLKNYFELNKDGTFVEPRTPRDEYKNKIIAIPVSTPGHATVMLIDCSDGKDFKDRIKYFDSSTAACEVVTTETGWFLNRKKTTKVIPKAEYFGDYANNIEVLNKNMQINGTCSYWCECFIKVLVEDQFSDPRKYDTMDKIKTAFQNGTMQMNICVEMSKMFDEPNKETVRYFPNSDEVGQNKENYHIFTIKDKNGNNLNYGIRKDFVANKYININVLVDGLSNPIPNKTELKEKLKNGIEAQRDLIFLNYNIEYNKKILDDTKPYFDKLLKRNNEIQNFLKASMNCKEKIINCIENTIFNSGSKNERIENIAKKISKMKDKYRYSIAGYPYMSFGGSLNEKTNEILLFFKNCEDILEGKDTEKNKKELLKSELKNIETKLKQLVPDIENDIKDKFYGSKEDNNIASLIPKIDDYRNFIENRIKGAISEIKSLKTPFYKENISYINKEFFDNNNTKVRINFLKETLKSDFIEKHSFNINARLKLSTELDVTNTIKSKTWRDKMSSLTKIRVDSEQTNNTKLPNKESTNNKSKGLG